MSSNTALITDIDDTFIERAHSAQAIADAWKLRQWADEQHFPIILITGADFTEVEPRLASDEMPSAEVIVTSVGTEIRMRQPSGRYELDQTYGRIISAKKFNRTHVAAKARELIASSVSQDPHLQLQFQDSDREAKLLEHPDPSYQAHKVSLYFFATHAGARQVEADYARLFPNFKIIVCEEINHNATLPPDAAEKKFCLDIVPAGKDDALEYLVKSMHITRGWKAGDSGNDAAMLLHPDPLMPILVGGYKPELYEAVRRHLRPNQKPTNDLYRLDDDRLIYIERGDRKAASSLIEAIRQTIHGQNEAN